MTRKSTRNSRKIIIGLIGDGVFHHSREILMGAKEWCLKQPAIQTKVFPPSRYIDDIHAQENNELDALVIFKMRAEELQAVRQSARHVVCTSSDSEGASIPSVIIDNQAIGRMAAQYFLHRRYSSFACAHRPSRSWSQDRINGFRETLREAGHEPAIFEFEEDITPLEAVLAAPRPVAVFCPSDIIARRLIDRMVEMDIHIPREMAVLGVDDDPYQNCLCSIPLSSVRLPGHMIGSLAAELAYRLSKGEPAPKEPVRTQPIRIVSRLSTDFYTTKDAIVLRALKTIDRQIHSIHGTEDLVRLVGIPRRTLDFRFRSQLGHTIHEELTLARLNKAREYLASTDMNADEIAERIGLSEGRMLTLLLKRKAGMTPSEFRRSTLPRLSP
jgi:LacI family transcriptional regulator